MIFSLFIVHFLDKIDWDNPVFPRDLKCHNLICVFCQAENIFVYTCSRDFLQNKITYV